MKTPIYDFLKNYCNSDITRLHMPGHKGRFACPVTADMDITEIQGADSLFESDGIIKESEQIASKLYKTEATLYSAGGSTLCIQAMLALVKREGRNVIALRNVHRSFLAAAALLGIDPLWIYPEYTGGILSGKIPMDSLEKALKVTEKPCVYITSPDYLGKTADIQAIAKLCLKYNAVLLVDNAHGAHLAFTGGTHPISLGADMCCDSAHKMLPALTGGAYLHIGNKNYKDKAKAAMSLFGSTSPNYLIMASLDLCNKYIAEQIRSDTEKTMYALNSLREKISSKYKIYEGEPYHLTLMCDGIDLSDQLRSKNIEVEYADKSFAVLLFSPCNTSEEIEYTAKSLMECNPQPSEEITFSLPEMEKAMTIREATLSDFEEIDVENSLGRICAAVNVPCPPAVPIAVSGEVINSECIKIFKRYGILKVNVIK